MQWRDGFEGVENSTVNSWLRVLKTLFKAAVVELDLVKNPAVHVPALPEDDCGYNEDNPNSINTQKLALLLDGVGKHRPQWLPLFTVLAYTGMRVSEATALKWSDITDGVSGSPGKILVRRTHWRGQVSNTTKTKRVRSVPLPREVASILHDHRRSLIVEQHPGLDEGWVFPAKVRPNRKGRLIGHSSVRNALLYVLKKLGEEGAAPAITVHGLRRTLNNLLRQHAAKEVTKAITGHVTDRMLEHYSTVGLGEKAEAVGQVLTLVRGARAAQ